MELTKDWTPVNTWKQYECAGKVGDRPTRFWETDRDRSTFEIFCKEDGYYEWRDWPTCIEGGFLDYRAPISRVFTFLLSTCI